MSALTDYEKNELSLGRRYRQYEHAYNAAFAADPNRQSRTFNETASKDDIQWKRLEAYRGNDRDAYHAHQSNPSDALAKPTDKEAAAWKANQSDQWRVEREPSFGQHDATNNKWLAMTPQARNSEQGQNFLAHVDQKHASGFEAYANKAGNSAMDRSDYLRTMAVVEVEGMRAAQTQQQAPAQAPQQQTTPAQVATAQNAPSKSRLSLANFEGPTSQYVEQRGEEIAKASPGKRAQIKQQAEARVDDVQAQVKDADSYTRLQSNLAELRQGRARETMGQGQSRSRSQLQ